jgi:hypothetical protein
MDELEASVYKAASKNIEFNPRSLEDSTAAIEHRYWTFGQWPKVQFRPIALLGTLRLHRVPAIGCWRLFGVG